MQDNKPVITYIKDEKFYRQSSFTRKAKARQVALYYRQKGYHARVIENKSKNSPEVWLGYD